MGNLTDSVITFWDVIIYSISWIIGFWIVFAFARAIGDYYFDDEWALAAIVIIFIFWPIMIVAVLVYRIIYPILKPVKYLDKKLITFIKKIR